MVVAILLTAIVALGLLGCIAVHMGWSAVEDVCVGFLVAVSTLLMIATLVIVWVQALS